MDNTDKFVSKYYKHRISASAIILIKEHDKIVLIREKRYRNEKEVVIWTLPGGLIEAREDLLTGVEREVLEETNLKVKAENIITITSWSKSKSNYPGDTHLPYGIHFYIGCVFVQGDPIPQAQEDIYEIQFVSPSDIYQFDLSSLQNKAIEKYLRGEGLKLENYSKTSEKDYRIEFY